MRTYTGAVYCRKIALAAVVAFVDRTKSTSNTAYRIEAIAATLFRPKPSRLVRIAMVSIANKERQNESSSPVSVFHLMNRPPVLQRNAAAKTKSRGELRIFTNFQRGFFKYFPKTPFHGGITTAGATCACPCPA